MGGGDRKQGKWGPGGVARPGGGPGPGRTVGLVRCGDRVRSGRGRGGAGRGWGGPDPGGGPAPQAGPARPHWPRPALQEPQPVRPCCGPTEEGRARTHGRRRPPGSMWKLGRSRVLLDEPPEEEDGLRAGPPPSVAPAAAAAAAQVRGRGWGRARVGEGAGEACAARLERRTGGVHR